MPAYRLEVLREKPSDHGLEQLSCEPPLLRRPAVSVMGKTTPNRTLKNRPDSTARGAASQKMSHFLVIDSNTAQSLDEHGEKSFSEDEIEHTT